VQTFGVNSKNELTNATRSGTLTVAGLASEPRGGDQSWGYPPGVSNVVVSGTGLTTGNANLYADGSWARAGAVLAASAFSGGRSVSLRLLRRKGSLRATPRRTRQRLQQFLGCGE
jgi:hypothetical protein